MAPPNRGAGGLAVGWSFAQFLPSHAQVSVRWLLPSGCASTSTMSWPIAGSSAINGPTVAGGLAADPALAQVRPSQVHVSAMAASPPPGPATADWPDRKSVG